ncbi:outer membrane beta-barrel protein, partial [Salmonella enterica]|uniref:outer membrane beta-barrel protein n=1 Tax=Salmonella enterica TaxID=28901 RepID=UPI003CEBC97B
DQQITSLQLAVDHRLTPRITVNGTVKYQLQQYNDLDGGGLSGSDDFYVLSTGAEYKMRENFYATLNYTWSQRVSGRSFAETINFSKN